MRKLLILIGLVVLCILSLVCLLLLTKSTILNSLFSGIFSSSFVVLIIEITQLYIDWTEYSFLRGPYERIKIENKLDERKNDRIYEDLTKKYADLGIDTAIRLNYMGENKYEGKIEYEEGSAEFYLNLDKVNPYSGVGTYQYKQKKQDYKMPDMGTFRIQFDTVSKNRLFVFHNNLVPSGIAAGYEIWQKV
jgi:hypothetical protein